LVRFRQGKEPLPVFKFFRGSPDFKSLMGAVCWIYANKFLPALSVFLNRKYQKAARGHFLLDDQTFSEIFCNSFSK
jgi:hypothetical protein